MASNPNKPSAAAARKGPPKTKPNPTPAAQPKGPRGGTSGRAAAGAAPRASGPTRKRAPARSKRGRTGHPWAWGLGLVLLLLCAMAAALVYYFSRPLTLPVPANNAPFEVTIRPQSGAARVAQDAENAGVPVPALLLRWGLQARGLDRSLRPGIYRVPQGISAWGLLTLLGSGKPNMGIIRLPEGSTFAQLRQMVNANPNLTHTTAQMDDASLMAALGRPGVPPEGRFFPDTYHFAMLAKDTEVWQHALAAMDKQLARAWANRDPQVPLQSPDEALILASIVEKETGLDRDRGKVASVFANRLRMGMRLQTDPTVIYGLGAAFDGNLTRAHLRTDTPYNSYTRAGLPPTPIAAPSAASLQAATRPDNTDYVYFVATGDGTGASVFSSDLDAHNAAVRKFQLKQ